MENAKRAKGVRTDHLFTPSSEKKLSRAEYKYICSRHEMESLKEMIYKGLKMKNKLIFVFMAMERESEQQTTNHQCDSFPLVFRGENDKLNLWTIIAHFIMRSSGFVCL